MVYLSGIWNCSRAGTKLSAVVRWASLNSPAKFVKARQLTLHMNLNEFKIDLYFCVNHKREPDIPSSVSIASVV